MQPFGCRTHVRLHQCYLCKNNFQMFCIFPKVFGTHIHGISVGQKKPQKRATRAINPDLLFFLSRIKNLIKLCPATLHTSAYLLIICKCSCFKLKFSSRCSKKKSTPYTHASIYVCVYVGSPRMFNKLPEGAHKQKFK